MQIQLFKLKNHRVKVTQAGQHSVGSITIDEDLMEASSIIEGEKVQIVNVNNEERVVKYAIPGERKSAVVSLKSPAARIVSVGDIDFDEAKSFKPNVIFPNSNNQLVYSD